MSKLWGKILISILVLWYIFFFLFAIFLCFNLVLVIFKSITVVPYNKIPYVEKELMFYKLLLQDISVWYKWGYKIDFETQVYPYIKFINDPILIDEKLREIILQLHTKSVVASYNIDSDPVIKIHHMVLLMFIIKAFCF